MRILTPTRSGWARAGIAATALAIAIAVINDLWLADRQPAPFAWAEERADDPQSVLPLCAALPNVTPEQLGLCAGYLKAIAHVMGQNAVGGVRACIPRATTVGFLRDVVVDFSKRNQALMRQLNTDTLVVRALAGAFPCSG